MSSNSEKRIDDGLQALVRTFLPDPSEVPEEEIDHLRQQHDELFQRFRAPLRAQARTFAESSYDVSTTIRRQLAQTGRGSDAAVRFGNIYSRLMAIPIINNKAGILHLLQHLSQDDLDDDDDDDGGGGFANDLPMQSPRRGDGRQSPRRQEQARSQQAPSERHRAGMTEVSSARLNRQSVDQSAPPKTPREAYVRSAAASRQARGTTPYPASPGHEAGEGLENLAPVNKSPTETNILRDLPFVLQGLSTSNLVFSNGETLALPSELPLPLLSILHTLAEPSLLYRNLHVFARAPQKGLVMQALQAAIESQLRAYLGLISTLESEIRRCLAPEAAGTNSPDESRPDQQSPFSMSRVGVTLKRCVLWTRDATLGLRLLSSLVEQAEVGKLKGGSLISLVHRFADANGDPFVSSFAERMLGHLTRPFYDMLRQWIYEGELRDPYGEFFVYEVDPEGEEAKEIDPKRMLATSVWDNKYKMNAELVPTIVDEGFSRKVFLIGKSLNFIRYSCGDSGWVEQYGREHSRELAYGDTAALESSIDIAYKTTMAHLIHLMDTKFGLFSHLEALKRYLLLGQGDFVALLIESLASNLDKPAGTQYRHTLTAQLDHAVRGSNAQFDNPEILHRLDARLLELTHGEIGWDVFTLEYRVDAPCDVVVTTWASKQYLAVFNMLWRIKRIEFALGGTWRRVTTGARTVLASTVGSSRSKQKSDLASDWKSARCTLSAMVHFITQLQYYIMVEVVEASWNKLQSEIRKGGVTLDDMVEAHTRYLRTITHRALLGGAKHTLTGNRDDAFPAQLHRLLKAMLAYTESIDGLYAYSVSEFTKKQEAAAKVDAKAKPGSWGGDADDDMDSSFPGENRAVPGGWAAEELESPMPVIPGLAGANGDTMLPALRKRMMELSSEFKTRLETLLGDLLMQPDQELKFLGVAMNYNDVYKPVRRKRRKDNKEKAAGTEKGKDTVDSRAR